MSSIAIIAALDRELAPLVRNWKPVAFTHDGRSFRAFENAGRVALAGGIGRRAAQAAAWAVVAQYTPQMLISAGLAGALISSLKVGSVITPNVIVDAATRKEYRCQTGGGVLVTASEVATSGSKPKLVEQFHALAVDMEAAAVAEVAEQSGISFRCVKTISDEAAFVMPPLNQFVDAEGRFQNSRFARWAMLRPQWWARIMALMRNSSRAAEALCNWLRQNAVNNTSSVVNGVISGHDL
jgi:adenosylhomocysteine nucleosidase